MNGNEDTTKQCSGGAWVAQSFQRRTSAQVVISRSVSLSPTSGSVLTAQSLEPASHSVSPSLSAPPPLVLCLSLSLKNKFKNVKKNFLTENKIHLYAVYKRPTLDLKTASD